MRILYLELHNTIIGPLLFNIIWCDLVLEHENCCFINYADDTKSCHLLCLQTIYQKYEESYSITQKLRRFANNQMKPDHDKYTCNGVSFQ